MIDLLPNINFSPVTSYDGSGLSYHTVDEVGCLKPPPVKSYSCRPFGINVFYAASEYGNLWFRIFGYGLSIKDTRKDKTTLFSQRMKLRGINIGRFYIRILK